MKGLLKVLVLASLLISVAVPLQAQQEGLVNVDISNIKTEIAKNIDVDVSQIPVTVQAPIGVAAAVCGINANVLAEQGRTGTASCPAQNTSTALNQIVQRQVKTK